MWLSNSFSSPRLLSFVAVFLGPVFLIIPLSARITLQETMPISMQKKTGVIDLSYQQKLALEQWLNDTFIFKDPAEREQKKQSDTQVYLSENLSNGKSLELSDGSVWEVEPADVDKAAFWITPFPLQILPNEDPLDNEQYPKKILNKYTGVTVKVKQTKGPNAIQPAPLTD